MGAGSFLSSLHLLSQLPVRPGVCVGSQVPVLPPLPFGTFIGLTVTSSGSEGWKECPGCGCWGRVVGPTFSLVDIWYPRGFSVSPPGQMIFRSFGMTWGWEYEMEGGHAGVLAPGP